MKWQHIVRSRDAAAHFCYVVKQSIVSDPAPHELLEVGARLAIITGRLKVENVALNTFEESIRYS